MNALFGLHLQISVGESLIVGTAVRAKFIYQMTFVTNFCITYPSNQEFLKKKELRKLCKFLSLDSLIRQEIPPSPSPYFLTQAILYLRVCKDWLKKDRELREESNNHS